MQIGSTARLSAVTVVLALLAGPAQAAEVDILRLVQQGEGGASELLGSPDECGTTKYGRKCSYRSGVVEVVFIKGKADWVTIRPKDATAGPSALRHIGLPGNRRPDFENRYKLGWSGYKGLLSIDVFPAGAKVDYIYVKARTR